MRVFHQPRYEDLLLLNAISAELLAATREHGEPLGRLDVLLDVCQRVQEQVAGHERPVDGKL